MRSLTVMDLFFPAIIVLVGAIFWWMPRLTRRDLWFAVTVAPAFRDSPDGRRILRAYRLGVGLSSAAALLLAAAGVSTHHPLLASAGLFVQLAGYTAAFLVGHYRTLPRAAAPSTVREAQVKPRRRAALPGGAFLQAGPFAILAAAAVWIALVWNRIPARFPTHWGLSGQPDRWASRTIGGVFGSLVVGALLCGLLLLLGYGIVTRSRRIHAGGPAGAAEDRFRFVALGLLLGANYFVAFSFGLPPLLAVVHNPSVPLAVMTVLALGFTVAAFVLLARTGQGGARLAPPPEAKEAPVGDRSADARWKLGLFYVNRDDPALFVEKRFGLGYTVNFGNPWCWILLAAIIALPLAVKCVLGRS